MRDLETNERKTKREEKKEEEIGWSRNIWDKSETVEES